MVKAPGRIAHVGAEPFVSFGELGNQSGERAATIAAAFAEARGLSVALSTDILADLWKKFMLIAPWGGVGGLTRAPIGVMRSIPETRAMLVASIQEVFAVALAHDVAMDAAAVDTIVGFIDKLPHSGTASMQRDIMAGRPSELHEQTGAVVRFGEAAGVATPVNRFIYHSLLPLEQRARGEIEF
jgi:2-dehydropantoate 2-reductase